MKLFFT